MVSYFVRILTAGMALGLIGGTAQGQASYETTPGLWVFEASEPALLHIGGQKTPMPGAPQAEETCIKPDETVLDAAELQRATGGDCEATGFNVTGNTVTGGLTCTFQGLPMVGGFEVKFAPNKRSGDLYVSFEGEIAPGQQVNITARYNLTNTGEC